MKPTARGPLLALLVAATSLTACADAPGAPTASDEPETSSAVSEECAALQEEYPGLKGQAYDVGVSPGIGNYNNPNLEDPSMPDGLEPEILRAAGECLGFTVKYQPQAFDALIPAMKSERIQLISTGMYATEERAQEISFVTHMTAATAAVLPKGNPKKIEGLDDTCGLKVAAVTGTVENEIQAEQNAKCEAEGKEPAEAATYAGNDQAINAVRQGRSDYFLTDAGVAAQVSEQFSDDIEAGFAVPSEFAFGYGVPKEQTELLEGLHAALTVFYEDGTLAEAQEKWGFAPEQKLQPEIVAS
jgi:polar amino acid transport system substrate-binding protein